MCAYVCECVCERESVNMRKTRHIQPNEERKNKTDAREKEKGKRKSFIYCYWNTKTLRIEISFGGPNFTERITGLTSVF